VISQENVRLVERAIAAINARDIEVLSRLLYGGRQVGDANGRRRRGGTTASGVS
jgi:hypothetical protein